MRKKSFFVEIKFLVSLFAVIFACLAGVVIIATNALPVGAQGPGNHSSGDGSGTTSIIPAGYTPVFSFRTHTLFLTMDCAPTLNFLSESVIQDAIIQDSLITYGDSVTVSFNPFKIVPQNIGTTQITLSAMVYNTFTNIAQKSTRTAIVVVNACLPDHYTPCPGGCDDNGTTNPDLPPLRFFTQDGVLIFYILIDGRVCNQFILTADVDIILIANTARIQNFPVTFTATRNNIKIATLTIMQNCL